MKKYQVPWGGFFFDSHCTLSVIYKQLQYSVLLLGFGSVWYPRGTTGLSLLPTFSFLLKMRPIDVLRPPLFFLGAGLWRESWLELVLLWELGVLLEPSPPDLPSPPSSSLSSSTTSQPTSITHCTAMKQDHPWNNEWKDNQPTSLTLQQMIGVQVLADIWTG